MASLTSTPARAIQFHYGPVSSFSQRVWITLIEKKLNFELNSVDLSNKPPDFNKLYASTHPDPTARAIVPIIIDGSQKLIESNIISEYLDRKYNESGIKLFPRDAVSLAKVRWFVEVLSTGLVPGFVGLVHSKTQQDARQAKEKLTHCLKVLNTFIEQQGSPGGDYLLGSEYSYAEVAASPFLHRAIALLPDFRGYSLQTALQQQNLPRLQAYIRAALDRPSFQQTIPNDADLIGGYVKVFGDPKDQFKQ